MYKLATACLISTETETVELPSAPTISGMRGGYKDTDYWVGVSTLVTLLGGVKPPVPAGLIIKSSYRHNLNPDHMKSRHLVHFEA